MAKVATKPWFLPQWDISMSQSNLRVATTACPVAVEDDDKGEEGLDVSKDSRVRLDPSEGGEGGGEGELGLGEDDESLNAIKASKKRTSMSMSDKGKGMSRVLSSEDVFVLFQDEEEEKRKAERKKRNNSSLRQQLIIEEED